VRNGENKSENEGKRKV